MALITRLLSVPRAFSKLLPTAQFVPHQIGGRMASIFYMVTKNVSAKQSPGECLAIIIKPVASQLNSQKTLKQVEETLRTVFGKVATGATTMSDRFLHQLSNKIRNCLKTFTNPYIPTAFEKSTCSAQILEDRRHFRHRKSHGPVQYLFSRP